jgi:threonine aldolase
MAKYSFNDDYSEGVHPKLLSAIVATNASQQIAYGNDNFTSEACNRIRAKIGCNADVGVWFVPSGTSANAISIGSCLRPHESVIAASSGHIVVRETGAIEATGHKIIQVPPENGKLTVASIQRALDENWHFPHMARPKLVYISNATEIGTVYSKRELKAIKALCVEKDLLLFLDGARIGHAMASSKNDCTWRDIFDLTDMFWIGGTKNGSLLGEAIVIKDLKIAADFGFHVKQHGCLLAKSWVMGAQFAAFFDPEDDLFLHLAAHANEMAARLSTALTAAGHELVAETETNQVFAIVSLPVLERLQQHFNFYIWERLKDAKQEKAVIRLVTSWATDPDQVVKFAAVLEQSSRA